MSGKSRNVRVGVAVFIVKDGMFILGKRSGSHGSGSWGLPGGHLEFGETWQDCVIRETREEIGLEIKNISFLQITNDIFPDDLKHYITIFMRADWAHGEASILEPEKCQELDWFTYDTLPINLFLPIINLLKNSPNLIL